MKRKETDIPDGRDHIFDANGKKLFVGDLVVDPAGNRAIVQFEMPCFCLELLDGAELADEFYKVIPEEDP